MTTSTTTSDTRLGDAHSPRRTRRTDPTGVEELGRPGRGIPFRRLVRVEMRKLVDTRAGRGLLLVILGVTATAMGFTVWSERGTGGPGFDALLSAAFTPQGMLFPILGVLTAAGEWQQRTVLTTFTQEPNRLRVMGAKTVAAVLLGVAVAVLTIGLAGVGSVVMPGAADGEGTSLTAALVVNVVIKQVQGVLMGVALGALFLNVPLGILAYFLLPTLAGLVLEMHPWLTAHSAWFDVYDGAAPLFGDAWLSGLQWAQVATTSVVWILIPRVIGFRRVSTREIR